MGLSQIIFISVISITTFALSLLTTRIYAIALKAGPGGLKLSLFIGALFPILFIAGNIIGRISDGTLSRGVTIVIDVIAGIAFYALITSIVLGVIILIGKNTSITQTPVLGWVFLGVAALMALGGFIQARQLMVKEYTYTLKNAPASWNGKRAVLISDTHYGLVNYKHFSKRITDKILSLSPDFMLIAGDLYDGPPVTTEPLVTDWKRLTSAFPVFYAPGNHEEYGPYGAFLQSTYDAGFVVLDDKKTEYEGLQIAGITYRAKNKEVEAKKALESLSLATTQPTILINHPPTFQKGAQSVGVDLMVSGHTHRGQFWPIRYLVKAIYGKYAYGMHTDDTITTLTTSGVGTAGPPLRLFNTPEIVVITFKTQ